MVYHQPVSFMDTYGYWMPGPGPLSLVDHQRHPPCARPGYDSIPGTGQYRSGYILTTSRGDRNTIDDGECQGNHPLLWPNYSG